MIEAEEIVQKQVDAYNAHDLEKFIATSGTIAQSIEHPSGEVTLDGEADLRRRFGELFLRHFNVHVERANRIAIGNFVIDRSGHPQSRFTSWKYCSRLFDRRWIDRKSLGDTRTVN